MTATATKTEKFINQNPGHDKVYCLTMMPVGEDETAVQFDVVAQYGRRGGRQTFFVHAEGVSLWKAEEVFEAVRRTRLKHGYSPVGGF